MNAKKARPAMFDIADVIVKPAATEKPDAPVVTESDTHVAPSKPAPSTAAAENFRTSIYFSRAVHDKLRDIAHEERKTITDLINEGLDHVLTARHYPTVAELSGKKR